MPFSFNEEVDDGDTLGAPVSAYRTRARPGRPGRRPGLPPGPARARPRRPTRRVGHRAVRLPDQAQPDRQRRRPRHPGVGARPARMRWPPPATGSTGSRRTATPSWPSWPTRFAYEHDTLTPAAAGRRGRAARLAADVYRAWWAERRPAASGRRSRRRGARPPGDGLPRPGRRRPGLRRARPRRGAASPCSRPAASASNPSPCTTRRTCRRPTTTWASTGGWTRQWGADAIVHVGQARHPRVAARQGGGPVRGLFPRRGPRRRAARLPLRGQRPGRGHPGQAAGPRQSSSTTCCRP